MTEIAIPILDLKPQYQSLKLEIQAAVERVLTSCEFIMGKDVKQFEQEAAAYLGVKHAVALNSGTDALIIGLRSLGIGVGDEVITTPFSFFATAESISNVGATPVFVDVDLHSFNIDPEAIAAKITPRTKAIMPVHIFGRPANMARILEIAQAHQLLVIEDCAQSFGAVYAATCSTCHDACTESMRQSLAGKYTGTLGHVGAFSFFPTKNLGAYGDGGLLVTNDDRVAEMASILRVHGSKERYRNEVLGYNSRMDSLQAAILRVKLPYIDKWNAARRRIAQTYTRLLAGVPHLITPELCDGHVFHQYTLRVTNGQRDALQKHLAERGIGSMIYYPVPQDRLPVYAGQHPPNPKSDLLASQVISLPIWAELEDAKIDMIAQAIANFF